MKKLLLKSSVVALATAVLILVVAGYDAITYDTRRCEKAVVQVQRTASDSPSFRLLVRKRASLLPGEPTRWVDSTLENFRERIAGMSVAYSAEQASTPEFLQVVRFESSGDSSTQAIEALEAVFSQCEPRSE